MEDGCRHIVDMDLEKFFDKVNHDRLMSRLATRVEDKRVLQLVRRFLTAGVMIDGLVGPTLEGTPQGGPLSPLLSNIVLDEIGQKAGESYSCLSLFKVCASSIRLSISFWMMPQIILSSM